MIEKRNQPGINQAQEGLHHASKDAAGLAVEHNYRIRSKAEACQANQKLKAS
jgi:hypothetical protein